MESAKKRIAWVDIAKGIAIILVIAGHCFTPGRTERNVIFSFHMPLFFMMSGYTWKLADSWKSLWKKTAKDAVRLLGLTVVITLVYALIITIRYKSFNIEGLRYNFGPIPEMLFWATGYNTVGHPNLGIPWFFVSLFWAKFIGNIIHRAIKNEYICVAIFIALGIFGLTFSDATMLPQNLDVTFVAMLFMASGMLWKKWNEHSAAAEKDYKAVKAAVFTAALVFWIFCLYKGWFIEMAARKYDKFIICAIEGVCGSYVVCSLCRLMEKIPYCSPALVTVGRASLYILVAHYFDFVMDYFTETQSFVIILVLKIVIDVGLGVSYLKLKERRKADKCHPLS